MPLTENQQMTTPRIQGPAAPGKENENPAGAPAATAATAATSSGVLRRLPRRSRSQRRGRGRSRSRSRSRGRSQRRGRN